jgi:hypothetical protein
MGTKHVGRSGELRHFTLLRDQFEDRVDHSHCGLAITQAWPSREMRTVSHFRHPTIGCR